MMMMMIMTMPMDADGDDADDDTYILLPLPAPKPRGLAPGNARPGGVCRPGNSVARLSCTAARWQGQFRAGLVLP